MTFKEMVAAYVEECEGVEGAVEFTLLIAFIIFMVTLGFIFVWKFTLVVLFCIAALVGLFTLFAWASGDL